MLGDKPGLTQSSYRRAVAAMIRSVQARCQESDRDTADKLGVSAATVGNARNENGDLSAMTLLRVGKEYGFDAIAPVMLLIEAKAAPVGAHCTSDVDMPPAVARGQLFLVDALHGDNEINDLEIIAGAEAIEQSGQVFDTLRWRLNSARARGMTG